MDSEFQRINLWVSRSSWRKLGQRAINEGVSKSEIVRRLFDALESGEIAYGPDAGPARKAIRRRDAAIT